MKPSMAGLASCLVVALAISACASKPESAPEPVVAPRVEPQPKFFLNLDTVGGHFSRWERGHAAASGRLAATVVVRDPRTSGMWVPFAAVELCRTPACVERARLAISFQPDGVAQLMIGNPSEVLDEVDVPAKLAIGTPVDIELEWRGADFVQARLNAGAPQRLKLPFSPDVVRMVAGSADVTFKDVDIR